MFGFLFRYSLIETLYEGENVLIEFLIEGGGPSVLVRQRPQDALEGVRRGKEPLAPRRGSGAPVRAPSRLRARPHSDQAPMS